MTGGEGFEAPRLRRAPAERWASRVLPAGGALLAAAEALHLAGVHAAVPAGGATALSAAVAWGMAGRGRAPESLPWWIAVEGAWFAAAEAIGPLATLHHVPYLAIAQLAVTLTARRAAYRSDAVTAARDWREQRAGWLGRSHEWGLGGTHLIAFERTRLGELYTLSTKGTGKLASAFCNRAHEERIAECEDLPPGRVQVTRHGLAGRILVSVRRADPWAEPLLHPVACEDHEVELPEYRSILDPALVGQDPETGTPLAIPLYDAENGAKRVSITANSGGGKGVLEDDLFEHVTACDDALAVHLNLSVKGYEDEESWGPACWLTAYGPGQKSRAAEVLKVIGEVLEWRARNFKRGQYAPSPEHPAIIVFADESDAAVAAVRDGLNMIATKGRSHGVGYVHLGQRNTRDYADPKARTQDNVRCTGLVQNANEARHAGSGAGPDMSTYGEGKPGVWKIEVLGGSVSMGRTWVFHTTAAGHGTEVERIARERAYAQPAITGACADYLGERYAALLAGEAFTRWAREQDPEAYAEEDGGGDDAPATEAQEAAPPAAPQEPDAGTRASAPAPAGRTAVAEQDPLEKWLEMDVAEDPDTDERSAVIRARLADAGQAIGELAARPRPEVSEEARAAYVAERWRRAVPADVRPRLLELLDGDGTTSGAVAEKFGVSRSKAKVWLVVLREEGIACVEGERRGAKWRRRAAPPPGGGDAA